MKRWKRNGEVGKVWKAEQILIINEEIKEMFKMTSELHM